MKVVFFDKMKETYKSVEHVIQLDSSMMRINSRITGVWLLILENGTQQTFKQKDFTIYRMEV